MNIIGLLIWRSLLPISYNFHSNSKYFDQMIIFNILKDKKSCVQYYSNFYKLLVLGYT
jgi:hypothetical protein